MHGNLNDKMQHDAFEFYENFIDSLSTQCLTVDENFKAIFMTFVKCFDCGRITGDPIKREKSIILSIPQLKKPVTLESLIYSKYFCNINNRTKIVKCDCDSGTFIHESSIFLQPPKVLVIYTSRNIDGRKYYDTAVEIPASLYFDHLVAGKHPSFTYSLVSVIYRYGNIVKQGHFNCALFSNNSVCKVFDDAIIKHTTYEEVLLDVVKQRHRHVCFYILDKVTDIQTFAKRESFEPWSIDSGIMKSLSCYLKAEHLFHDRFSRIKLVVDCKKRLNDNIIDSFMCSLKPFVKQDKISIVNPLLATCLSLTGAHKRDLFRRTLTQSDLLTSSHILILLFIKSCHWALLVLTPSEKLALYFDPFLSFSNLTDATRDIFFFFQIFCKYHNLDEVKWKLLIHDYTQQQNNDKDCGVFCCINAYCFIYNKDILLKDSEALPASLWIERRCLEVEVAESFKTTDVLDENKLEHLLKELNSYQIDQYAVSAYSSSGTNHEHWAAMRIAKLNLCQLDAPVKFGLKMEGFQDCLDSENNDDNECYQSTSPGMKFSKTLLIAVIIFGDKHARCIDIVPYNHHYTETHFTSVFMSRPRSIYVISL